MTAAAATAPLLSLIDVVLDYPDALLLSWSATNTAAWAELSQRERDHARGLVATAGEHAAAEYLRERLRNGDVAQAAAALRFDPGARIWIDRTAYTVVRRRGESLIELRGPRGGRVDLHEPIAGRARWSAWVGGLTARHAKSKTVELTGPGRFVTSAF